MQALLSLLLLALAVSLDGFGVGVTYGLRKIRIPFVSVGVIAICSAVVIYSSMQVGALLLHFLPAWVARAVGAFILIGIGCWAIAQVLLRKEEPESGDSGARLQESSNGAPASEPRAVVSIELRTLGLVIQILRTPSAADVDRSGAITGSEALLLGLALSIDSLGAGIGAALVGFSPIVTSCVIGLASGLFVTAGMRLGYALASVHWVRKLSVIPGCILIVMGIMKLM